MFGRAKIEVLKFSPRYAANGAKHEIIRANQRLMGSKQPINHHCVIRSAISSCLVLLYIWHENKWAKVYPLGSKKILKEVNKSTTLGQDLLWYVGGVFFLDTKDN